MATLIDTSLWIDFTRAQSPQTLKQFIAPYILDPDAHVAEPVVFEVLRHAMPGTQEMVTAGAPQPELDPAELGEEG